MALRKILLYPDPRLRRTASPVDEVNAEVRTLVDDMMETIYQAPGLGLAAIQLGVTKRVIVIDISKERNVLHVLINPEIYHKESNQILEEGCLSVPGIYEPVSRAERIRVRALDRDGKPYKLEAAGLLAACIQHEIDHLDGKVFIDYVSRLKQSRIRKKLEKQQRLAM